MTRSSLLAQAAPGEVNEDILQTGVARGETQQVRAALLQGAEQGGDGLVSFTHAQHDPAVFHMDRLHTRERPPQLRGDGVITRGIKFHYLMPAKFLNQFGGTSGGDGAAMIDDGDAVAKPLRFVHIVRRQQDGPAAALELTDDVPKLPPAL